jgi:phytoene synthase
MTAVAVSDARRHCEEITRTQAANFYYGIRLLPPDKRGAMCAVYAFARGVDDIGDGGLVAEEKLRRLDGARRDVETMDRGSTDPVMAALAEATDRFALPPGALFDLIDGVRMDVTGTRYDHFDELLIYCRRVAGSIGRLCLAIFSSEDATSAQGLADDLGVAMQLTNILRDVREDAERGRVYLPAEDLARFGWMEPTGATAAASVAALTRRTNGSAPDAVGALVRFEAERARQWFERGLELVPLLDRRSAACVLAMTGIYRRLLGRIEASPEEVLRSRVSLPVWEKAWVAARSMMGAEV